VGFVGGGGHVALEMDDVVAHRHGGRGVHLAGREIGRHDRDPVALDGVADGDLVGGIGRPRERGRRTQRERVA